MIPIDQTRTAAGEGNCLAACVASLLHLHDDDLPTFPDEAGWWRVFEAWLRKCGFYPLHWLANDGPNPPPGYAIGSGTSPRFPDTLHAVVCQDGVVVHDPHPDRSGLVGDVFDWIVLVPLDPREGGTA